jgi:hypothetical protein
MTDRWDEEARTVLRGVLGTNFDAHGRSERDAMTADVAAALRGAYEFGTRCRVDSAFQELGETDPRGGECVDCNGEGYLDRDDGQQKCPACDGTGRAE